MLDFSYAKKTEARRFPTGFIFWATSRVWKNLDFVWYLLRSPIGRMSRPVHPYFAFLQASLRYFFGSRFASQLTGTRRFFRFSLNGGDALLSYNMKKNLIFIFSSSWSLFDVRKWNRTIFIQTWTNSSVLWWKGDYHNTTLTKMKLKLLSSVHKQSWTALRFPHGQFTMDEGGYLK